MLDDIHINIVFIPPYCKDHLQQHWYLDQIFEQQDDGSPLQPITSPMHVMKPLGGHWLKEFTNTCRGTAT